MVRNSRLVRALTCALSGVVWLTGQGCIDRAHLAATLVDRGSVAVQEHWDYELAGAAVPEGLMRLEGLLRLSPDDELILIQLVRGYSAYGYGFVEEDLDAAELDGRFDDADRIRGRAARMYDRALGLGKRLLSLRAEGFEGAMAGGEGRFRQWLETNFDDPEADTPVLFWCGYAWGLRIRATGGDPETLIDFPYAKALVERSVALDERFFHAAGLTFLGSAESILPSALGGDPEKGRAHFERALELTERRALAVQLNYARSYAAGVMDRPLFDALLREVVEAGDVLPAARLTNKMAQRRARQLLDHADELF